MITNLDIKKYFVDGTIDSIELEDLKDEGGISTEVNEEIADLIYDYIYALSEEDDEDDSDIQSIFDEINSKILNENNESK